MTWSWEKPGVNVADRARGGSRSLGPLPANGGRGGRGRKALLGGLQPLYLPREFPLLLNTSAGGGPLPRDVTPVAGPHAIKSKVGRMLPPTPRGPHETQPSLPTPRPATKASALFPFATQQGSAPGETSKIQEREKAPAKPTEVCKPRGLAATPGGAPALGSMKAWPPRHQPDIQGTGHRSDGPEPPRQKCPTGSSPRFSQLFHIRIKNTSPVPWLPIPFPSCPNKYFMPKSNKRFIPQIVSGQRMTVSTLLTSTRQMSLLKLRLVPETHTAPP